mgnify:FL=1
MHDYELFRPPDAVEQAFPFDPTSATREQVDTQRAEERTIRADQTVRVARELERLGYTDAAQVARLVDVEPGW